MYDYFYHPEGVDLVPANIALAGTEVSLVNAMSRETVLKQYLDTVKKDYDFILLDCMPSLGMLTVNALAAADQALIPVQANYLSAKGLEQLLNTINKVRRQINPKLRIEGILLTMVDARTNDAKDISQLIRDTYGVEPMELVHKSAFHERDDHKAAAKGKGADIQHGQEQFQQFSVLFCRRSFFHFVSPFSRKAVIACIV